MNTLVFDCFSGASGDMIVSSLINAGADASQIKSAMESAADVSVHIEKVTKNGISATKVDVVEHNHTTRTYNDVVEHVKKNADAQVIADVLAIFKRIGEAEAKVHGKEMQEMHFHEVGADDAIADVVGAVTAIRNLGVDTIYCTEVATGSGFVETSHGTFPVPAPATMEILANSPLKVVAGNTKHELLTPTGAAILAHFVSKCDSYDNLAPMKVTSVGYGAGGLDLEYPNVLRAVIGVIDDHDDNTNPNPNINTNTDTGTIPGTVAETGIQLHETTCASRLHHDEIMMLETNVDDTTGEVLGNLINELVGMGAKDALIIPATMKKGRCGHVIKVIAKSCDVDRLAYKIVKETGSLGVRVIPVSHRLIAHRRMEQVTVIIGGKEYSAHVKVASDGCGALLGISAEFDDCREIAQETGVMVKSVLRMVEEAAWKGMV